MVTFDDFTSVSIKVAYGATLTFNQVVYSNSTGPLVINIDRYKLFNFVGDHDYTGMKLTSTNNKPFVVFTSIR